MKVARLVRAAIALGLITAAVTVAGCANHNPGMVVVGNLAPTNTCVFGTENNLLLFGILDTSSPQITYEMTLRVFNQLRSLGDPNGAMMGVVRADPNHLHLERAEVEIRGLDGNAVAFAGLPNPFSIPISGFVPSGDGIDPGIGAVSVSAIPSAYGEALRGMDNTTLNVNVRMVGETEGDVEMTSGDFGFQVNLCNGCLFVCRTDDMGVAIREESCNPGQDTNTCVP